MIRERKKKESITGERKEKTKNCMRKKGRFTGLWMNASERKNEWMIGERKEENMIGERIEEK